MNSSFCDPQSCWQIYDLQPLDVGEGKAKVANRRGQLEAFEDGESLPVSIVRNLGNDFVSLRTKGDGGCGLHAVWGCPNAEGELECPGGQDAMREKLCELMPESLVQLQRELGLNQHLSSIVAALWSELTVPAATGKRDEESQIFWSNLLQYEPELAQNVESFLQQKQFDDANRNIMRNRYRMACNTVFTHELEELVIRPLAEELACSEFIVDQAPESRYASLFLAHDFPEFDRRRQSFLEFIGKASPLRLARALDSTLRRLDSTGMEHRAACEWRASYEALRKTFLDAPAGYADAAWRNYRRTLCSPTYYLSSAEVLLFARLSGIHVATTLHRGQRFQVESISIYGAAATGYAYISLNDDGSSRVRGHFERICLQSEFDGYTEAFELERHMHGERLLRESREGRDMTAEDRDVASEEECNLSQSESDIDDLENAFFDQFAQKNETQSLESLTGTAVQHDSLMPEAPYSNAVTVHREECGSAGSEGSESSDASSASSQENEVEVYLNVSADQESSIRTEQDIWKQCCQSLAEYLRDRPTLPPSPLNVEQPFGDLDTALCLPLYSCPFRGCTFSTDIRKDFLDHFSETSPHLKLSETSPHLKLIETICEDCLDVASPFDLVCHAIGMKERATIPAIGLATTRRALRTLVTRYNDSCIKALVCFVCGQIHTTLGGPEFSCKGGVTDGESSCEIQHQSANWFNQIENLYPGTLLNNCSFELWKRRYAESENSPDHNSRYQIPKAKVPGAIGGKVGEYSMSEWCLNLKRSAQQGGTGTAHLLTLFGITEDVICTAGGTDSSHHQECNEPPYCKTLCEFCRVPVCESCRKGLYSYRAGRGESSVGLSLANDNFYGYALKLLVERRVTWLECAASSLVWSTIMVYYLEQPYGHLMLESMEGAQARTQVRGNLFSFMLPWEDIERRCVEAQDSWETAIKASRKSLELPHSEEVLATLVNVHIVGGTIDLVKYLEGATMRIEVVMKLIDELRGSGYPGYMAEFNDAAAVKKRMEEMYGERYRGAEAFVPDKIRDAAEKACRAKLAGTSLIYDKNATPAEPISAVHKIEESMRPLSLVANRSSKSASTVHEEHGNILARYQSLEITTGSTMMNQFHPAYLGMANPFTLPMALGGYDLPGQKRWRRPEKVEADAGNPLGIAEVPLDDLFFRDQKQVALETFINGFFIF